MDLQSRLILAPLLALIAATYSAVGLGGGTAYLAVLAFWTSEPDSLRPIAWLLNSLVTAVGFVNYYRSRHFDARASWPYLVGGTAGAVGGALLPIGANAFRALLAATLLAVGLRAVRNGGAACTIATGASAGRWPIPFLLGLAIGALSGLVGIGGGIVLGPIVLALGWLDAKRTAALTSLYVFVCSAGALSAHLLSGGSLDPIGGPMFGAAVLAGGYAGSWWGAVKAHPRVLQRLTGVIALSAAVKLVFDLAAALR